MNYGCGSTMHARDLANQPRVLYVGTGGSMELLQFACFTRQSNTIIRALCLRTALVFLPVKRPFITEARNILMMVKDTLYYTTNRSLFVIKPLRHWLT